MERPLLSKSDGGDSSSNDDCVVDVTDEQTIPHEAEVVQWCNPCTKESVWNLIEFVLTLVQIVATVLVVTRAKDEHPQITLFILIIGYTCGCIVVLPTLSWCLWQYSRRVCSETRIDEAMDNVKEMVGYFFVGWVVLLLWVYLSTSSSLSDSTQHFWLCMAFFAFSFIRYVLAHPRFATIGLCFDVLLWINAIYVGISPNLMLLGVVLASILIVIEHTYYT